MKSIIKDTTIDIQYEKLTTDNIIEVMEWLRTKPFIVSVDKAYLGDNKTPYVYLTATDWTSKNGYGKVLFLDTYIVLECTKGFNANIIIYQEDQMKEYLKENGVEL